MMQTLITYTRHQFRLEWRTTVIWAAGLCLYAGLIVAIFPSVRDAVNIDAIPPHLRLAFNLNDFTQLANFLSSQLLGVILPLLLPFYAMIRLSNVVAGAEEQGRMDILLGNPIPRWQVLIAPWITVGAGLAVVVAAIGVTVWAVAAGLDLALTFGQAMRSALMLWPTAMAFGSLALFCSTCLRQRSTALLIPAATVFIMYLANVVGRLAPDVSWVRYGSAYNYYGTAITDGIWWSGVAVLVGAAIILLAGAIARFDRRDIYA
jgi:ABC-2 type transport system permease protein